MTDNEKIITDIDQPIDQPIIDQSIDKLIDTEFNDDKSIGDSKPSKSNKWMIIAVCVFFVVIIMYIQSRAKKETPADTPAFDTSKVGIDMFEEPESNLYEDINLFMEKQSNYISNQM